MHKNIQYILVIQLVNTINIVILIQNNFEMVLKNMSFVIYRLNFSNLRHYYFVCRRK